MLDSLKTYIQLASGLTEATAAKAKDAVTGLIGQGLGFPSKTPDMVGSVQELADDLVATSKSNRDLLVSLIRTEVDKAVGRVGFVREDELAALRRHVQRLDEEVKVISLRCADCSCCAGADVVIEVDASVAPTEPVAPTKKKVPVTPEESTS